MTTHGAPGKHVAWHDLVRGEYLAMPGLALTTAQLARLLGGPRDVLVPVLDELVERGFLERRGELFVRAGSSR
ncbi:MAG: hypothetical protein AB7O67_02495 [Vicinamibacterales bacterium]